MGINTINRDRYLKIYSELRNLILSNINRDFDLFHKDLEMDTEYYRREITKEMEKFEKYIQDLSINIGIVGQVKAGKSTLVNSIIFKADVLPAAATPMTATLSIISFSENEKIKANFYSKESWQYILEEANRETNDQRSKAAKELVETAKNNQLEVNKYLGKSEEKQIKSSDLLPVLQEYVGRSGRFTPITESVEIFINNPNLSGIKIIDTPGVNDPIVSREMKTREFLKEADVILLVLYFGRAYDSKDDELFELANRYVSKVVILLNKVDSAKSKEEIDSAVKRIKDIVKQENIRIIPVSGINARLSYLELKEEEINKDRDLKWYFEKKVKGLSKQELWQSSNIDSVIAAINDISKESVEIKKESLKKKIEAITLKFAEIYKEAANKIQAKIELSSVDIDRLKEEREKLQKQKQKTINRSEELESKISEEINKASENIERVVTNMIKQTKSQIEMEMPKRKIYQTVKGYEEEVAKIYRKYTQQLIDQIEQKIKSPINISITSLRVEIEKYFRDIKSYVGELLTKDIILSEMDRIQNSINLKVDELIDKNKSFSLGGFWIFGWNTKGKAIDQMEQELENIKLGVMTKVRDEIMENIKNISINLSNRISKDVFQSIENEVKRAINEYENKEKNLKTYTEIKNAIQKKIEEIEKSLQRNIQQLKAGG